MRILLVGHGKMGRLVESLARGARLHGRRHRRSRVVRPFRSRSTTRGGATWTWPSTSRRRTPCSTTFPPSPGGGSTSSSARPAGRRTKRRSAQAVAEAGYRHRRRAELFNRCRAVRGGGRRGGAAVRGRRAVRRVPARSASRDEEGRALGNRPAAETNDGKGGLSRGRSTCRPRARASSRERIRSVSTDRRNRLRCPTRRAIAGRSHAAR